LKEIYAYGPRNPYRIGFDRGTGTLYVGNVGQGQRESVDTIAGPATTNNFGWPYFEGTRDNQADTGRTAPAGFTFTHPIAEYTHADGEAIIGGTVYRGTTIPSLVGKYVFGDLGNGTTNTVGRLFYTDAAGGTISEFKYDTTNGGLAPSSNLYGFGEGQNGELYAFFSNGDIVQFVPEPAALPLAGGLLLMLAVRRRTGRQRGGGRMDAEPGGA
jgi:glucose/arabinose dehydrogenase